MDVIVVVPYLRSKFAGWLSFLEKLEQGGVSQFNFIYFTGHNELGQKRGIEIGTKYTGGIANRVFMAIQLGVMALRSKKTVVFYPSFYLESKISATLIRLFSNKKVVVRICANELTRLMSKCWIRMIKPNVVIALNEEERLTLSRMGLNVKFVPNFIESIDFAENNAFRSDNLLYIGELSSRKGLYDLYKFSEHYRLMIDCFGPSYDIDLKSSNYLNISEGRLSKYEVNNKYKQYGIFILASYSEGMANVVLEALSKGMVVIGSDIPGIRENIVYDFLLFSPGELTEMYSAFSRAKEILEDPLRYSAYRECVQEFLIEYRSKEVVVSLYKNIFSL